MTERKLARRHSAMWVLAPVTAGVFGVSTSWAIHHNPVAETASAVPAASAPGPAPAPAASPVHRLRALEARLGAATAQYNATRRSFLVVERAVRRGETRLAALRAGQESSGSGSVSVSSGSQGSPASSSGVVAPPAAAPAPAPAPAPPAPPAPPASTTTGAS